MENLMKQILAEVQDLKSQMNSRFDMLETRMANMETRMDKMETRMASMETRMDKMETRMASMENEHQSMKRDIASIKETMATKEDVADIPAIKTAVMETAEEIKKIKSTQERHDRTLDLLSRRSIDQEADIAELRQTI